MAGEVVLCTLIVVILIKVTLQSLQDDIAFRINDTARGVLSRKRRYLVFPEGSSLQLVYCLTMPSIGMGQIFTIGSTAALAWELPHDPFTPFRRPSEVLHRIDSPGKDTSGGWTLQNSNSPSPVSHTRTHYNPFLVNKPPPVGYTTINGLSQRPSFYSIVNPGGNRRKSNHQTQTQANRKRYKPNRGYGTQSSRKEVYSEPVTTYLHPVYHKVYRRTRRDLYTKLEKLFTALSRDGRECLLKSVCEVSRASRERGTFMEEIIKAIFRVRHHQDETQDEKDTYDFAANSSHNCTDLYPNCQHSIWTSMFP